MSTNNLPSDLPGLKQAMLNLPPFQFSLYRSSFEGFMKRIKQIEALQSVEKYRIVFIGEPGKGKTTAICNWLNLLKSDKSKIKSKEKMCLLTAAAGRTTVSEVHIKQSDSNSVIRLSYMPIRNQEGLVREFCKMYWEKFFESADGDSEVDLSIEHYRLIRNMAGLDDPSHGTTEKSLEKNEELKKFMMKFNNIDDFYNYVIRVIGLPNRQQNCINYDGNSTLEDWLSEQFHNINYGLNPSCSIMDKVYIELSKKDLDMKLPNNVAEIIDTIGLDSEVRPDLQKLMQADDTICFLMDDVTNVPSVLVRNLIKNTFLCDLDLYKTNKVSIFVKSPITELMAVNEAQNDSNQGKEIKIGNITTICMKNKVPYQVDNTLFADSCAAYIDTTEERIVLDDKGNPVFENGEPKVELIQQVKYRDNTAQIYRIIVNTCIDKLIKRFKDQLLKDIVDLKKEVENLIRLDEEYQKDAKIEVAEICNTLKRAKEEFLATQHYWGIVDSLMEITICRLHWARVKKLNRIYGGPNNSWKDDIYTSIYSGGRNLFVNCMRPHKEKLNRILIDIRNEKIRSATDGLVIQIDTWEKEATERVADKFFKWAMDVGFYPQNDTNIFWTTAQNICGKGYTENIRRHYAIQFNKYATELEKIIQSEIEQIYNGVFEMFEGARF